MKNMLNFQEFTADELMDILNLALDMKKKKSGQVQPVIKRKEALYVI